MCNNSVIGTYCMHTVAPFYSVVLLVLSKGWACFITCCEWNQTCKIYCGKYLLYCSACSGLYWFNRKMWSNETGGAAYWNVFHAEAWPHNLASLFLPMKQLENQSVRNPQDRRCLPLFRSSCAHLFFSPSARPSWCLRPQHREPFAPTHFLTFSSSSCHFPSRNCTSPFSTGATLRSVLAKPPCSLNCLIYHQQLCVGLWKLAIERWLPKGINYLNSIYNMVFVNCLVIDKPCATSVCDSLPPQLVILG